MRKLFVLVAIMLPLLANAATGPGTGLETAFTQTLKILTTAAAWRTALGLGNAQTNTTLVTNTVSLSASNATSKPILRDLTSGVASFFGLQAGSGATVTPNGTNLVIAVTSPVSISTNGVIVATSATNFNIIGSTNISFLATNDNGNVSIQILAEANPQMAVFTNTASATNWVVPSGTHKVRVRCWGAGGSGGFTTAQLCSGGGGGGYAEGVFSVTNGTIVNVIVGLGGTSPPSGVTGFTGGTSSATTTEWLINASGGAGGSSVTNSAIGGSGGFGGGGLVNLTGESGEGVTATKSGGGGHGALGGAPGRSNGAGSGSGQSGRLPGGGGAGNADGSAAGEGGHGMIILEFSTQ